MEFEEVLKARRAVREYRDGEITDGQIRRLFDLASLTPSAYNLQPWEFIVVRDKQKKKLLRKCCNDQEHVEKASAAVIIISNTDPTAYLNDIDADEKKRGRAMMRAQRPIAEKIAWARRDGNLAAMTIMLAAQSIGFSTCPIGAMDEQMVRKEFGIPEKFELVLVLTLGYGKAPAPRPQRKNFEGMVHFEKF
ncbi:nitroreductase family protein [Candidatus Woesearchaeota archaeon]|nr:nitroreductase family protein [Candidatus Woesearchaeota archaeon]